MSLPFLTSGRGVAVQPCPSSPLLSSGGSPGGHPEPCDPVRPERRRSLLSQLGLLLNAEASWSCLAEEGRKETDEGWCCSAGSGGPGACAERRTSVLPLCEDGSLPPARMPCTRACGGFLGGAVILLSRVFLTHRYRSHEWKKHGTCAAQLDALNSQRKYFSKSLDLYKELALSRWETQACM